MTTADASLSLAGHQTGRNAGRKQALGGRPILRAATKEHTYYMARLKGKIALVTGAASGIGEQTARRFAAEGAHVAAMDMSPPRAELRDALGARADFYEGDVREEARVEEVVAAVLRQQKRIDILVNAAGVGGGGPSEDIPLEEWDRIMDINLKGSFLSAKHAVRPMLQQGSGAIVNIASIEGMEALPWQLVYGVSKAGVIQMTRNMAIDFAPRGVRVNCVCPGAIDTPLLAPLQDPALQPMRDEMRRHHMLKRFGKPEEIAACILFLASEEASFVTGHALVADGGYTAGRHFAAMTAE